MATVTIDSTEYEQVLKDAERWRKLQTLLQQAYDSTRVEIEDPVFSVDCGMVFGRRDYRLNEATIRWSDVRDEPLDLTSTIDKVVLRHE